MAASSAGVPAFDKPLMVVDDEEALYSEAQAAKTMGYDRKLAVNTDRAEIINDVFTPSEEKVSEAQAIINKFEFSLYTISLSAAVSIMSRAAFNSSM